MSAASTLAGAAPAGAPMPTWMDLMFPAPEEIRTHAPLIQPLLLLGVISLASAAALRPAVATAFAGPDRSLGETLQTWLWLVAAAAPLIALVKGTVLAATIWSVATLMDEEMRFRRVLSTVLFAELVPVLAGAATAAFLHLRGLARIAGPADLRPPFTFDVWLGLESEAWVAVAQATSIWHVLWFAVLAAALPRVTGAGRAAAATGAALGWALLIGVGLLRVLL